MADVVLKNIQKIYDGGVVAVQDFNLEIADKEFIVLVGPSGCGKSTTLRMVAGLEAITRGELYIGGKLVNHVPPKERDIAMVFQNYALYPHMTVYDNIAYGLKLRKFPRRVIEQKVREAAEILDITELLKRKPKALSGGQRQRVAIGRAIVRNPQVFLMDEPLSNLDAKLRNQMRTEIIKLRTRINTTFLYVTHDQTEAMTLGDRIVIMKDGFMQQVGTPRQVFSHPANLFVAGFIGTPQMNFFDAALLREGDAYAVDLEGVRVPLPREKCARLALRGVEGGPVTLGVRPEHIHLTDRPDALSTTVDVAEMLGSAVHVHTTVQGKDMVIVVPVSEEGPEGRRRGAEPGFPADALQDTDAAGEEAFSQEADAVREGDAAGERDAAREGDTAWETEADLTAGTDIRFLFRGSAAHVFDRETGENLEGPAM